MEKIIKESAKKVKIPVDVDIMEFIQVSKENEEYLANIFPQNENKARVDQNGNHFILVKESLEQSFSVFYHRFDKVTISIGSDDFQSLEKGIEREIRQLQSSVKGCLLKMRNEKVIIAGQKQSVQTVNEKIMQKIQELKREVIKKQEQKELVPLTRERIQLLDKSGSLDEIREQYTVQVEVHNDKLVIIGQEKSIEKAKLFLMMKVMNACPRTLKASRGNCDLLQTEGGIHKADTFLRRCDVDAVITVPQARDEVIITALSSERADFAVSVLEKAMQDKEIPLFEGTSEVLQSEKGDTFLKELEKHYNVKVQHGPGPHLLMVGIDINEAEENLLRFLDKNAVQKRLIGIKKGLIRFIFENCKDQLGEIESSLTSHLVTITKSDGAVLISGSRSGLNEAVKRLENVYSRVSTERIIFQRSGVRKLFRKMFIKDVLRALENELSLIIINEIDDIEACVEGTPSAKHMVHSSKSKNRLVCSFKTREGKSICIFQGDITKHNVDIIVNPANNRLLLGGGVAGAILEAGGRTIQDECDRYIRTSGELADGEVAITGAGKIKCERIIHTVGPKWQDAASYIGQRELHSKQETAKKALKLAIENTLDAAQQYQSIAIPAVSSGVFGFPKELCAEILLSTAIEFCQSNPSCNLREIHFVNIDSPTVKAFEQEFDRNFKSRPGYIKENAAVDTGKSKEEWWKDNFEERKLPNVSSPKARTPKVRPATKRKQYVPLPSGLTDNVNALSTPERIEINLVVGDLATQKVPFIALVFLFVLKCK